MMIDVGVLYLASILPERGGLPERVQVIQFADFQKFRLVLPRSRMMD